MPLGRWRKVCGRCVAQPAASRRHPLIHCCALSRCSVSPPPHQHPHAAHISASNAAQALLLLLPEWRLAAILPAWKQHGAMRRILTTLLALLPPLPPAPPLGPASGSRPAYGPKGAGRHAQGTPSEPPLTAAAASASAAAFPSQPIGGGRSAPLLQLVSTVLLLSRDHPSPLIEEMLATQTDLSR